MWYINTVFKIVIFLYILIGCILSAKSGETNFNMQCCVFEMQDALKGVVDFIGYVFLNGVLDFIGFVLNRIFFLK